MATHELSITRKGLLQLNRLTTDKAAASNKFEQDPLGGNQRISDFFAVHDDPFEAFFNRTSDKD